MLFLATSSSCPARRLNVLARDALPLLTASCLRVTGAASARANSPPFFGLVGLAGSALANRVLLLGRSIDLGLGANMGTGAGSLGVT